MILPIKESKISLKPENILGKNNKIKIAIVEDDPTIREGVFTLINSSGDFECSLVFDNCESAVNKISADFVDVVLMDISLSGMSGIEGVKILKEKYPQLNIIMLTVYEDNNKIFDSLKAGASGYLLKKTPIEKILEAIKDVYNGGSAMSPAIARKVLNYFSNYYSPKDEYNLSERESQVLEKLVAGLSYKMIAGELFISIDTVRTHIKNIYLKLHVNSKSEAVVKALKNKLR